MNWTVLLLLLAIISGVLGVGCGMASAGILCATFLLMGCVSLYCSSFEDTEPWVDRF